MSEKPIPSPKMPEGNPIFCRDDEAFVDIEEYSLGKITADMKYAKAGRPGAITRAFARKTVADMLLRAAELLPVGYSFKVFDAWRPYEVQKSLYDEYFEKLKSENPSLNEEKLHKLSRQFVSYPDKSQLFSYVHSSGGAVDITVVDEFGRELDMGTEFDDFSPLASTDYFENSENVIVKKNRRVLYFAMTRAGFTNFPNEWWHYDYGDIFYGKICGEAVKYPSVYSMEQMTLEDKKCPIS